MIKQHLFITYHLQTDDQSEALNQIIKKKISAMKNHIEKLHKLHQKLHLQLMKVQE